MTKRGQVWIETVIYILIGLALIALVLAYVMPKINEQKDRSVVEQTIVSLSTFNDKISEIIDRGKDNRRIVEFSMRRGEMYFIPQEDKILFVIDELTKPYSEPNIIIPLGRVRVITTEERKTSRVNLTIEYASLEVDLTFNNKTDVQKFNPSSVPYKFAIENYGIITDISGKKKTQIDINLIS